MAQDRIMAMKLVYQWFRLESNVSDVGIEIKTRKDIRKMQFHFRCTLLFLSIQKKTKKKPKQINSFIGVNVCYECF